MTHKQSVKGSSAIYCVFLFRKNASSPAIRGGGRANSSPSLSSMVPPSALQPPGPCIHQSHSHLDQLKTLKLDHNRLVSLCVSHDKLAPSVEPLGLEEANKSPSRVGHMMSLLLFMLLFIAVNLFMTHW